MFLRKHVKLISEVLFFCLLAWYSRSFLKERGEDLLFRTWNHTFYRFGPDCIYWITVRLAAWIPVYLHLLHLESRFFIYLFLRQRSYGKVFLRTYGGCVWKMGCYYGVGTLIMAIFHSLTLPDMNISCLLLQGGLLQILAKEGLEALNFCLLAYVFNLVFRNAEAGFLVVLAGRLLLNFVTGGGHPALLNQLAVNLVMLGVVYFLTFRDFAEKYVEE